MNKKGVKSMSITQLPGGGVVMSGISTIYPANCPHYIFNRKHYRDDGSCRCDDPAHTELSDWGYRWDPRACRWVGDE